MIEAYSRLSQILQEHRLTVPALHRRIQEAGHQINLKSLYRLSKDSQPVERLDLHVAGVICAVCKIPLTELIQFSPPRQKLRRIPAAKQKRLDVLMGRNNDGDLSSAERKELRELVREAEEMTLHNARVLARQRERASVG